jgi:hypothetical protein
VGGGKDWRGPVADNFQKNNNRAERAYLEGTQIFIVAAVGKEKSKVDQFWSQGEGNLSSGPL